MNERAETPGVINVDAIDPFDRYDLGIHEGRDLFFRRAKIDFDAGTLSAQQAATAKAMLFHYYGYAMGASLGTNTTALAGQLQATGHNDEALGRALDNYNSSNSEVGRNRYDFYSRIQVDYGSNGVATRGRMVDVVRNGRTVTLNWDRGFSDWASHVGVGADEALRKTDFSVYQALIGAAFQTSGLSRVNISGAWRPSFTDYQTIYESQRVNPSGSAANISAMESVIRQYPKGWGIGHVTSRGIDVNAINGVPIRNSTYVNGVPTAAEPQLIASFTDALLNQPGTRQIFQPWRMWADVPRHLRGKVDGEVNKGSSANEILHRDHLHYGR